MDPLLESLLWLLVLLPAVLLALALAAYLLTLYWEKAAQADLKHTGAELRSFQSQSSGLRQAVASYSPDDPEPYGSVVNSILSRLDEVEQRLHNLYERYIHLRESVQKLDWREPRKALRIPYDMYILRQDVASLTKEKEHINNALQDAVQRVKGLERLGWEAALQARNAIQDNQTALNTLTGLHNAGINDPELESALEDSVHLEKSFEARVPVYFLSGDEATVLEKADKATIAAVHDLLHDARPAVSEILTVSQAWQQQYEALEKALSDLADGFRAISAKFGELESSSNYPINLDESRGQLSSLRQQIEALGTIKIERSLDQLDNDLALSARLIEQMQDLYDHFIRVSEGRTELMALLENPDIQQGREWCRKVQKLVHPVEYYDPENWPRAHAVHRLRSEVEALEENHDRLEIKDDTEPIQESELEGVLDAARQLAALHQSLRPRVANIQARLTEIQETERNTKDQITRTRALINQAASIISSNPHLSPGATPEVEQLRENLEALSEELDHPDKGPVDKKAQRANTFLRKVEQAGNKWLDRLEEGLDAKRGVLAEKVEVLAGIATLEDPPVVEAESLLKKITGSSASKRSSRLASLPIPIEQAGSRSRRPAQLPFTEVVPELKRKNETWQRCVAVIRALEDIEGPIHERYQKAQQHADGAKDQLAKAIYLIPGEGRTWPPTTQFLSNESRQFEALEARWESLREEPMRAIQLVSRIGELAEEYQNLESKLAQIVARAEQEQTKTLELENRLAESMRMWQSQMQSYSNNYTARDEILQLIEEAENEAEGIRQDYLRGAIPYNQVVQFFRGVCQKLEGAQAAIDEEQVIDINGIVQRRY